MRRHCGAILLTAVWGQLLLTPLPRAFGMDPRLAEPDGTRPQIIVRLPVAETDATGRVVMRPNVEVGGRASVGTAWWNAERSIPPQTPTLSTGPASASLSPLPFDGAPATGSSAPPESPGLWQRLNGRLGRDTSPLREPNPLPVSAPPAQTQTALQVVPEPPPPAPPAEEFLPPLPVEEAPAPLPAPSVYEQFPPGGVIEPTAEPLFEYVVQSSTEGDCDDCRGCGHGVDRCECHPCWGGLHRLLDFGVHDSTYDIGIGHERVGLAPFVIDTTQPFNNWRLRFDSVYGVETPDRAEYIWSKPGKGPELPERSLDYQDIKLQIELGGKRFSALTELPLRLVDPVVNGNTTGFGDMVVGNKTLIVDGRYWQITQVFRTYINTGSSRKGLGTGHLSMEPGVLARYHWNDRTFVHGELKYWFPIGADKAHSGQVLRYGLGVSHLVYETDTFAIIPTLEFVGWTVFDGLKTLPDGFVVDVDGDSFTSVNAGTRFVLGPAGDLGLFEVGTSGGVMMASDGWFDSMFRVDLRWSF